MCEKMVNIVDARLLSLEKSACKVGCRLASEKLALELFPE